MFAAYSATTLMRAMRRIVPVALTLGVFVTLEGCGGGSGTTPAPASPTFPPPSPPSPPTTDPQQYCNPRIGQCLHPRPLPLLTVSCVANGNCIGEYWYCDPFTQRCTKPFAECTAPSTCDETEFCAASAGKCATPSTINCNLDVPMVKACNGSTDFPVCDLSTGLCVQTSKGCEPPCKLAPSPSPPPPYPPTTDLEQYCNPRIGQCLRPRPWPLLTVSCVANENCNGAYWYCDPFTQRCTKPLTECTAPTACSETEFCAAQAGKCATPSTINCNLDVLMAKACNGSADFPVCDLSTGLCVKTSKDCGPPCGLSSSSTSWDRAEVAV